MTPQELLKLIPELDAASIAFPAGEGITNVYRELTPIAIEWEKQDDVGRGHWSMQLFSTLFFNGGSQPTVSKDLEGIEEDDFLKVLVWVGAAMRSYYPKHEHKEVVCAMLWDAFFIEPEEDSQHDPV